MILPETMDKGLKALIMIEAFELAQQAKEYECWEASFSIATSNHPLMDAECWKTRWAHINYQYRKKKEIAAMTHSGEK